MAQEAQRILVADDTEFFRTMLTHVLTDDGYEVEAVADGEAAFKRLTDDPGRFHLLLADLLMPGLNGFQLMERLRRQPEFASLPMLALTQYGLNDLERGILKLHRVCTLSKSASLGQILFTVAAALTRTESEARRHVRAALSIPLTVRAGGRTHVTECFNLSEDGMFVVLPDSESPGQGADVELRFWVPEATEVLQFQARVVWVNKPGSLEKTHPPGFGVQLVDPDQKARAMLQRYLDAHS
jgi:CheY-like chemotaxis protein